MADEIARIQQYEYRQNSNLVLQVDYNLTDRRARDEPTGEVLPLTKDILTSQRYKMGDRYHRATAPGEKKSKKLVCFLIKIKVFFRPSMSVKQDIKKTADILIGDTSGLAGLYRPKTAETRHTFEVMLSFIQEILDTSVSCSFLKFYRNILTAHPL
jgi:pre-mRNA-splicing helicase BRR2